VAVTGEDLLVTIEPPAIAKVVIQEKEAKAASPQWQPVGEPLD